MGGADEPQEAYVRRSALFLILAAAGGAALAAALHLEQPESRTFDLVVTTGLSAGQFLMAFLLWRRLAKLESVFWASWSVSLAAILLPAWFYTHVALTVPGVRLVDVFPPVSAGLLVMILGLIVFAPPRMALTAGVLSWLGFTAPIAYYFAQRRDELVSPRGMDMAVTLGPMVLGVLAFVAFHRGVSRYLRSLQEERTKMAELAERDGLTGLYNRRASEGLIGKLVSTPDAEDALILFDVDHFKRVNDGYGHAVGDEVLRQIARRCEAQLRRDDLFARWGGEEFLVLVRGARPDGARRIADDLRRAIAAEPIGAAGTVTASFGVACFRHDDAVADWLQRADRALYAAKQAGRNRVEMAG